MPYVTLLAELLAGLAPKPKKTNAPPINSTTTTSAYKTNLPYTTKVLFLTLCITLSTFFVLRHLFHQFRIRAPVKTVFSGMFVYQIVALRVMSAR